MDNSIDIELNDASQLARSSDPTTSREAAESLSDYRKTMAKSLLKAFKENSEGLTAEEASLLCGYSAEHGAWKRVSDLRNAGYIEPKIVDGVEATRVSSSNRKQRVMVLSQNRVK